MPGISQYHCQKENQGKRGWRLAISYDCSVLNWDQGPVDCGTNILHMCWLFWQNKIQVYCHASSNIVAGKRIRGRGVTSHHFIWLLSIKLWSWSCRLWYQHSFQVLTLLKKRDSGLLPCIFQYCCRKENQGEEGGRSLTISYDCSALTWDRGLVHCGTNILHGYWLSWQNKIQVYCRASSNINVGKRIRREGWRLAISLDFSALNWDRGLVHCGTNILHGCWLFCQNEVQVYCGTCSNIDAGKIIRVRGGDVSPFHYIAES
jgi:hypothetical protein